MGEKGKRRERIRGIGAGRRSEMIEKELGDRRKKGVHKEKEKGHKS